MTWPRSERVATAVLATVAAYIGWFGLQLQDVDELLPVSRYAAHAILMAISAAALTVVAFQRRKRRAREIGAILFAASGLFVLALTDALVIGLRFDTSGPNWNLNVTHSRWVQRFVRTNEAGFWERSLAPYRERRTGDRYLIAAVGDSFTFGQGVLGARYRFTDRLQEALQARFGNGIEVLNFGLGAGDTRTETEWVRTSVASTHPDMVIVFYLANDIVLPNVFTPRSLTDIPRPLLIASPTFNYLYWYLVGPLAYRDAGAAYFKNLLLAYSDRQQMDLHLGEIEGLIGAIREIGARPAFVILPFPHMWNGVDDSVQQEIYTQILMRVEAAGADALDLSPLEDSLTPAQFQVNHIDGHPNEEAHALIAGEVYEWMLDTPEIASALHGRK